MLQIHREILKEFEEVGRVAKVILFGSLIRGDYRLDSDIDLFILTNKKSVKKKAEKIADKILVKHGKLVSLKFISEDELSKRKSFFLEEVFRKGKIIYHGK